MTDQQIKKMIETALRLAWINDHQKDVFKTTQDYFKCLDKLREKFNDK